MNRRAFLSGSALLTTGVAISGPVSFVRNLASENSQVKIDKKLYDLFREPGQCYHPFVRWWWNGDKVEASELVRELRLLKDAGIGGVEINPVQFPTRFEGDDLGKPSLQWLSDSWIDMLKVAFDEAHTLGLTCDLIVGSGWPFGAEYLEGDERSQIVVIAVRKIEGPTDYEISLFEIFREADPAISSPFPGRTMELLSLKLVPDPLNRTEDIVDLPVPDKQDVMKISVPAGRHALYALVKINSFMQVINGAPGATGPVLNHYNSEAVKKYLYTMSDTIQKRIGPLSGQIRAFFTDSMELEGSNWSSDFRDEFKRRNGYDIFPFLPFVLFKVGAMGNVTDFNYGVAMSPEFREMTGRMRYDFEVTKADILEERFTKVFAQWCKTNGVKSRAQAYGRGFYPLEGSFDIDIPECESWTTNWLKHRVGEEMPEDDYRRGRAYTMINKYVSSAAHLKGKRLVSCEEMTDTYTVFNTSLENLKIGGDQSAITGVTHSVFHGFNYSPPEVPYPGWIRYGAYYNEKNTWWPYFHLYNEYKGRLASLLQHSMMYADIAILPPLDDMWTLIGSQNEPFPSVTHVEYMTLVWEAMNKNGNGCDYVSQKVIRDAEIKNGQLCYGPRKYNSVFLIQVDSLNQDTAIKLYDFIVSGGRIFCIESLPSKSAGWSDHDANDKTVTELVEKMKAFTDRFILLKKPEHDFIHWYQNIQKQYNLRPYVIIEKPDPFVMQNRYISDDGSEIIFIINSNINDSHKTKITFSESISSGNKGCIWDPETGNKFKVKIDRDNAIDIDLGPAESLLFVFDKKGNDPEWNPLPTEGQLIKTLTDDWTAEFIHCHDGSVKKLKINKLTDLKEMPDFVSFSGEVIYRNQFNAEDTGNVILNLGKVHGVSEVTINGRKCGVKWYGRRIWNIDDYIITGVNTIEVKVITSMGNYMKSLTDNRIAQYWTNEKSKNQPLQSMGLIGPVTIYKDLNK